MFNVNFVLIVSIENRIHKVDVTNEEETVGSDYRATIHKRFSESEVRPETVRQLVFEDFTLPLDSRLTERLRHIYDGVLEVFPGREIITLSPLGVVGLDQYLTKTSALKIAHVTGKPADVVADPTIQLAAEIFRRRRGRNENETCLGTRIMCTRLQKYSEEYLRSVFEMFGTIDSAITSSDEFESEKIVGLVNAYSKLLSSLEVREKGRVTLGNLKIAEKFLGKDRETATIEERKALLRDRILESLNGPLPLEKLAELPFEQFIKKVGIFREGMVLKEMGDAIKRESPTIDVQVQLDRVDGLGHYCGPCFSIDVGDRNIVDGGAVDWVSKLTSNRKERTVVSGLGTQLVAGIL